MIIIKLDYLRERERKMRVVLQAHIFTKRSVGVKVSRAALTCISFREFACEWLRGWVFLPGASPPCALKWEEARVNNGWTGHAVCPHCSAHFLWLLGHWRNGLLICRYWSRCFVITHFALLPTSKKNSLLKIHVKYFKNDTTLFCVCAVLVYW